MEALDILGNAAASVALRAFAFFKWTVEDLLGPFRHRGPGDRRYTGLVG